MTLRRPVAQAAQTRCGPIHEPHNVFREPRFYDRSQGCRRHAQPRGFGTPKAHMVAIEGYGISLSQSAIF
jgi:hypothetical protein